MPKMLEVISRLAFNQDNRQIGRLLIVKQCVLQTMASTQNFYMFQYANKAVKNIEFFKNNNEVEMSSNVNFSFRSKSILQTVNLK